MKLLTPRSRGGSVWAYTSSFGGGLVAGDRTELDLDLGRSARCFVGTQASTKIYRNPAALPTGHRTSAILDDHALLAFAPDPVQAFARSSYSQKQEFRLGQFASLVLVDWVTAGRTARGERWELEFYHSRNDVFVGDHRVFVDSLLLEPADGALTGKHRLGRFNCIACVLFIGPMVEEAASRALNAIAGEPVSRENQCVVSASRFRHGVVVRVAGVGTESVGRLIQSYLKPVTALLDDPWSRKW